MRNKSEPVVMECGGKEGGRTGESDETTQKCKADKKKNGEEMHRANWQEEQAKQWNGTTYHRTN